MSNDFDPNFDRFFPRKPGKQDSKDFTWSGTSAASCDPIAAMDQIEQKIATWKPGPMLCANCVTMLRSGATASRSDAPDSALPEIKLEAGEPKKFLPALRQRLNLPKR